MPLTFNLSRQFYVRFVPLLKSRKPSMANKQLI